MEAPYSFHSLKLVGVLFYFSRYNIYSGSLLCPKHIVSENLASGPITSWQIDGETVETVADFIFLGSKITADGDCSHEVHETRARTWCSGRTWRERVEREVGGGIGMGKTCKLKDI